MFDIIIYLILNFKKIIKIKEFYECNYICKNY